MRFVQKYKKYYNIFYRPNSEKLMTKFSNKLKNLYLVHFESIFTIFGVKKIFLENITLPRATSYGFLAPCQNLEKVNDTIQRKRPDR